MYITYYIKRKSAAQGLLGMSIYKIFNLFFFTFKNFKYNTIYFTVKLHYC